MSPISDGCDSRFKRSCPLSFQTPDFPKSLAGGWASGETWGWALTEPKASQESAVDADVRSKCTVPYREPVESHESISTAKASP